MTNSEPAAQSETRRTRRGAFTGQKIGGNRITAVQGLLNSGVSKVKIAKDLKISRNSVIAIEQNMKAEGISNPHHVESIEKLFRGKLTRIVDMNMRAITPKKVNRAPLAVNIQAIDKGISRLVDLEGRSQPQGVAAIMQELGFVLSTSVSKIEITTVEQAEIIEATASNGLDPGSEEAKQAGLGGVIMD